jgi:hypothetical protein
MHIDGSDQTQLTHVQPPTAGPFNGEGIDDYHTYWSPDGTHIEYAHLDWNFVTGERRSACSRNKRGAGDDFATVAWSNGQYPRKKETPVMTHEALTYAACRAHIADLHREAEAQRLVAQLRSATPRRTRFASFARALSRSAPPRVRRAASITGAPVVFASSRCAPHH